LANLLGLLTRRPIRFEAERRDLLLVRDGLSAEKIQTMIDGRTEARSAKDYARADAIRHELDAMGVIIFDSPQGTTWKLKS